MTTCSLCLPASPEHVLWQDARCRVIDVGDPDYAGYCRVVWSAHVREMSDLTTDERVHVMAVVQGVEISLRTLLNPVKINLAAFGNQVPHLHWHVIPRFSDDPHFPDPIWATRRRSGVRRNLAREILRGEIVRHLGASA